MVPSAAEVELGVPLVSAQRRLEIEAVVVLAEAAVGRSMFEFEVEFEAGVVIAGTAVGKSGFGFEVEAEAGTVFAGAAVGRSRFESEVEAVTEALVGRQLLPAEAALAAVTICIVEELLSVVPAVDPVLRTSRGKMQQPPRSPVLQPEPVKYTHNAICSVANTPRLGVCIKCECIHK